MFRKLQNSTETLVEECIEGFYLSNPNLPSTYIPGTRFLVRKDEFKKAPGKVKLVAAGGAGHEPGVFYSVAPYSTDLFILGDIYAAPAWKQIYDGIKMIDDGSPILLEVSNHAGDIMNANMAYDMLVAEGVNIRKYNNWNDVASAPKGKESERRGIGGSLGRIVGVAAESGLGIDDVERLALKARDNNRSYAVGFRSAIHPITGNVILPMEGDEIELGIGLHGESSGKHMPMPTSAELAKHMCDILIEDLELNSGEEISLNLNGLGGLTCMETSIFYKDVCRYLESKNIKVFSGMAGNFSTTQEMGGVVLSIGRVDDEIKQLWGNQ